MDHSDASGSSTFFLFLYLFFLMKDYGSIVIFPTFIVYFVSLVLSASPFSSKLVVDSKQYVDNFQPVFVAKTAKFHMKKEDGKFDDF